jgi:hypothetical protein
MAWYDVSCADLASLRRLGSRTRYTANPTMSTTMNTKPATR